MSKFLSLTYKRVVLTFNFFIISTSKGLISDKEAKILGLGGEVLLKVD